MDIKRMRHAIALAEELSFARTAEKLNLSQPALSRSIQTLEEELGMLLFDRDNRNVALTTVGAVFIEQARRLVYQARGLERDMKLIRNSDIGTVAFGAGPLPTAAFLPPLLGQLRREKPGLQLLIRSNNWRYLLMHLHAEEIEFFVADTRDIEPSTTITITPLCRQFGPFICRPGHPLLSRSDRQPSDMLPYGFASLMLPKMMRGTVRKLLGLEMHEPLPLAVECDNIRLLSTIAAHDDVILLATEAAVAPEIRNGTLVPLPFPGLPPMYAEIGIVQLFGRTISPAAGLVLERLGAVAAGAPSTSMYVDGAYRAIGA